MANITLNSLVYVSQGLLNRVSSWVASTATGVAASFNRLTGQVSLAEGQNPYTTVKWKLVMPFVKTDPAACPCPGEAPYSDTLVNINVRFDSRVPSTQRDATLQSIKDLVANAQFGASISSLTQPS